MLIKISCWCKGDSISIEYTEYSQFYLLIKFRIAFTRFFHIITIRQDKANFEGATIRMLVIIIQCMECDEDTNSISRHCRSAKG